MNPEKNKALRDMLNAPGLIVAPGCHDCITARLIEDVGFKVAYAGGNGMMGSLLGVPDIGIGTMTDMATRVHQISSCIDIPLICDADAGYGNINNVWCAVREFEAAGASGIHIEDQTMPKKCGAMAGVSVEPIEVMVEKIKVALAARRDKNFVIIARTDSGVIYGTDEVIRRLKAFGEAGADVLMPVCVPSKEDNIRIMKELQGYNVLADMCEFGEKVIYSDAEVAEMGFKIVTHPLSSAFYMSKVMRAFYEEYYRTGTTLGLYKDMNSREAWENTVGMQDWLSLRSRVLGD